jgi:hypothetical protein
VISLRYHVVTIVAVFLSLALGLLAGSAFVQPRLVDQLKKQTDQLRTEARDLRSEITDIRAQVTALGGFADAALPYLAEGRLLAEPVVIVAQEGVQDSVIAESQRALNAGGANVIATFSARAKLASIDETDQRQLAQILGQPDAAPEELPGLAASAIATRLATAGKRPDPANPDVLHELLSAGFLTSIGSQVSDATLEQIGGPTQVVVVLSGGPNEEPSIAPETFAVPMIQALETAGLFVAAGQSRDSAFAFVEQLRADGNDGIVTVDDLDASMGGAALVLGLQRLIVSGLGGAYGLADGTEVLPPPL